MVARPPAQSGKTAGAGNYHTRYRARPRDALEAAGADDLSRVVALQAGVLGLATGVGNGPEPEGNGPGGGVDAVSRRQQDPAAGQAGDHRAVVVAGQGVGVGAQL